MNTGMRHLHPNILLKTGVCFCVSVCINVWITCLCKSSVCGLQFEAARKVTGPFALSFAFTHVPALRKIDLIPSDIAGCRQFQTFLNPYKPVPDSLCLSALSCAPPSYPLFPPSSPSETQYCALRTLRTSFQSGFEACSLRMKCSLWPQAGPNNLPGLSRAP
jgi:hypothetical protein